MTGEPHGAATSGGTKSGATRPGTTRPGTTRPGTTKPGTMKSGATKPAAEPDRREVRQRLWQQLPLLVALVVLWMVLWTQFTGLSLLTGIVVAIVVTRVFYLPPVDLSGRINVWHTLVFLAHFLLDVAVASFQVAFQAIASKRIPHCSVIGVQLRTRSDLIMTLDGIAMSLVPGSLVVEADRERSILYLHTFATESQEDVEAMRRKVLVVEARIVRAIGSKADLARIRDAERRREEVAP